MKWIVKLIWGPSLSTHIIKRCKSSLLAFGDIFSQYNFVGIPTYFIDLPPPFPDPHNTRQVQVGSLFYLSVHGLPVFLAKIAPSVSLNHCKFILLLLFDLFKAYTSKRVSTLNDTTPILIYARTNLIFDSHQLPLFFRTPLPYFFMKQLTICCCKYDSYCCFKTHARLIHQKRCLSYLVMTRSKLFTH